jgi:hypothetical protein
MLRALFDSYLRHRFAWLLGLLIAAVGVDPVLEAMGARGNALEWMLAFSLLVALIDVWQTRAPRLVVAGSSAALLVWLMLHMIAFGWEPALARAVLGVSGLGMAGIVLSGVIAPGRVDAERICAALCVYLLIGLAFGGFFASLDASAPGSLVGTRGEGPLRIDEAVYFSFVTLATLGYGDFAPVSTAARALAVLEAVFGQLFLAVLVARLVSQYMREE